MSGCFVQISRHYWELFWLTCQIQPYKDKDDGVLGGQGSRVAGRDGREGEGNGCRVREKKSTSLTRYFLAMESFCGLLKWGVCPALCKALH